jgi:hypothetical protein
VDTESLSRRRFLGKAVTGGAILAVGPSLWRQAGAVAAPPAARHLQFGADPAHSMVVSWSTPGPVERPVVDVGPDHAYGLSLPAESRPVRGTDTVYHHALVTGLEAGRAYRYRPRHNGADGAEGLLRTAPEGVVPFTFTAFGDQGTGPGAWDITVQMSKQAPAFHLHAGDLCYAYGAGNGTAGTTDQAVWDRWLDLVSNVGAWVPWMPALGNHEMEVGAGAQGYDGVLSRFSVPATGAPGVGSTYTFRYSNVAVVALDANDASYEIPANRGWTEGRQDAWLEETLAAHRRDPRVDWIVAYYHHCSYCTNAVHASDLGPRERWDPLFAAHGVDLVVNGHNHCYERTHALREGSVVEKGGTVFVTAGGGGQVAYQAALAPLSYVNTSAGKEPETAPWSAVRHLDLSFLAVDVDGDSMTLRGIDQAGREIDRRVLTRQ